MSTNVLPCEFAEKTYETRANAEINVMRHPWFWLHRSHPLLLWAPGQVAEKYLGFDVAVTLQGTPPRLLMKLLDTVLPPGFDIKDPYPGSGTASAPDLASLFFQYKRSDHVLGGRAKGAQHFEEPFFRFKLDKDQHKTLEVLASAAAGQALVRYVAPLFHTNQEFIDYSLDDGVLGHSRFLDVQTLTGLNQQHSYAAFDANEAVLCSEPEPVVSDTLVGFFMRAAELEGTPPEVHIRHLAAAVRDVTDIANDAPDSVASDFRLITEFTARNQLQWRLFTPPDRKL